MSTVFLVYKTDAWHSYASRDLIGVASAHDMAVYLCQLQADKEHEYLNEDQLFNLNNIQQTQGYSGEGEFHFEELDINELI